MLLHKSALPVLAGISLCALTACQQSASRPGSNHDDVTSMAAFAPLEPSSSVVGSEMSAAGRYDMLSVLTFNMQHRDRPKDLALMADRLSTDFAERPDFILCQEVLFERSRNPAEANTAAVLANQLGYFWRGTKRTSDREGVAILSRYPFEFYDSLHLKSQTSRLLLGFRRVSVMAEFTVPEIGLVRVVNVHFTNWGFEDHVREKQLEETLHWMIQRESKVQADLIVLGGDFNMKPGDNEWDLITKGQFASKLKLRNFNTDEPTRGGKGDPNTRVDYIFVASRNRDVRIADGQEQRLWEDGLMARDGRKKVWLSDHLPVLHEYSLRGPAIASAHVSRADADAANIR